MMNRNSYDVYFKRLMRNKSLLAYILQHFVREYKNVSTEEILRLINTTFLEELNKNQVLSLQQELTDEYGKVELDKLIAVKLPDGSGQIGLFINFEMQRNVTSNKSLLPRATYYVSKAICMQKNVTFAKSEYHNLLKVYGIWFCIVAEKGEKNSLNYYVVNENRILGNRCEKKEDYDKSEIIMAYLAEEDAKDMLEALTRLFIKEEGSEEKMKYLKDNYGIDLEENEEDVDGSLSPMEFWRIRMEWKVTERLEKVFEKAYEEKNLKLEEKNLKLEEKNLELEEKNLELEEKNVKLEERKIELEEQKTELEEQKTELEEQKTELEEQKTELEDQKIKLEKQEMTLMEREIKLQRSIDEGVQNGIQEGEHRKLIENLKVLMKNLNESYERVGELLGLNGEEVERYRDMVCEEESKYNV